MQYIKFLRKLKHFSIYSFPASCAPSFAATGDIMPEEMAERDVFSEQEVTEIIRRAIAIQDEEQKSVAYVPGVTRSELERIAKEIGVDPSALSQAISERGAVKDSGSWLRLVESFERVLDGELDPNDFDIVADNVRPLHSNSPSGRTSVSQVGRSLSVSAWTGAGSAQINVSSRNGRTKIEAKSSPLFPLLMTCYPALIGGISTAAIIGEHNPILGGIISLAVITIGALSGLKLSALNSRKTEQLTNHLAEAVREHLQESDRVRQNLARTTEAPVADEEKTDEQVKP